MKKIFPILLALAMALVLCACGDNNPPHDPNPTDNASENQYTPPIADDEDNSTLCATDDADETNSSADELWGSGGLLSLGTVNGCVYENIFLGYGCNLEGWTFADADMIAEINQWGQDTITSDLQSLIKNADVIIDMYAESEDGLQNINVQFQKMNDVYSDYMSSESEEILIDLAVKMLPLTLENAGYSNITVEKKSVMLGSDEHFAAAITGELSGVLCFQLAVCVLCENYAAYITATSFFNDSLDQIFGEFYKLSNNDNSDTAVLDNLPESNIICYDKYAWGTSFDEIEGAEITKEMVAGKDYGYYDSGIANFAKELVIDDEIQGYFFATHYDFDENDRLVSVMPVLGEVLSTFAITQLYLDLVEHYLNIYGEPDLIRNAYDEGQYESIVDFATAIANGDIQSMHVWTDRDGNQLVIDCYKGSIYIELVLIFSIKDYAL